MQSTKKIMSFVLALALAAATFCMPTAVSAWEERTNEVNLRIGFLNDTHITRHGAGETGAKRALSTLKALGMNKLALVGDVVYYPTASDDPTTDVTGYTKLYAAVAEAGYEKTDIIAYAMGNHEFPQNNVDATVSANSIAVFTEQTGFNLNHHVVQDGFHFVVGGAKDYNGSVTAETEAYLMTEIDKALAADSDNDVDGAFPEGTIPNSEKPVFLLLHHPMGTTLNNTNTKYSDAFLAFLAARPQIVNITAHMHRLAQHPETIWQDGFTAFQTPMTSGGYQSQWGCIEESEINDTMCSQGSFAEVVDNVVYLYRVDYLNGTYIGEPFVVNIPAIVQDRLDDNADNDKASMLYTAEKRAQVTTTAAFPEDAALEVTAEENVISVTYPNTAYIVNPDENQQDNFLRAYKLEAVDADGTVISSAWHQADFWKAPENRAATYTKAISGLSYETEYTVNVYPVTPFGAFGEPISTTATTGALELNPNTIRYEFEEFCPTPKLIASDPGVSGEKFVLSAQKTGYSFLTRQDMTVNGEITNPYTFEVPIHLPVADTYKVEYAIGYMGSGEYVSEIVLKMENGSEIGRNNTKNYDIDLSRGNTFPWNTYIPLVQYTGASQELSAGDHTVTVEVYLPTTTAQVQPFLFCMDYIQFTPTKLLLKDDGSSSRAEFEDYAPSVSYTLTNGSVYTPRVASGELASGGKYALIDSADGFAENDYVFRIPFSAQDAGMYEMKYVSVSNVSQMDIYIDSTDGANLNTDVVAAAIDAKNAAGKYPVFSSGWAQAKSFTKMVNVPEGDHELVFVIHPRPGTADIAIYLDYIEFTSISHKISGTEETVLEAEALSELFYLNNANKTAMPPTIKSSVNAGGGSYIYYDTTHYADHPAIRADIPVSVEKAGFYDFSYMISNVAGSNLNIYLDDLLINGEKTETVMETAKNADGKYDYFGEVHHPAKQGSFSAAMDAGSHILTLEFTPRPEQNVLDVAICMDYLKIEPSADPADRITVANGTATATVIYSEPVTGTAILAIYKNGRLVSVGSADAAEQSVVTITASAAGAPTDAKVFLWDAIAGAVPQTAEKELTIQ